VPSTADGKPASTCGRGVGAGRACRPGQRWHQPINQGRPRNIFDQLARPTSADGSLQRSPVGSDHRRSSTVRRTVASQAGVPTVINEKWSPGTVSRHATAPTLRAAAT